MTLGATLEPEPHCTLIHHTELLSIKLVLHWTTLNPNYITLPPHWTIPTLYQTCKTTLSRHQGSIVPSIHVALGYVYIVPGSIFAVLGNIYRVPGCIYWVPGYFFGLSGSVCVVPGHICICSKARVNMSMETVCTYVYGVPGHVSMEYHLQSM